MSSKAAITVLRPRAEVEQLWQSSDHDVDGAVSFIEAPGDRGTEIHIDVEEPGALGKIAKSLTGGEPRAKAMDALRRFKAEVETGEFPRSEAVPEGELAERKLKSRPAQPLEQDELEKAGV
jgi:uncharacterized membrane protein